MGGAQVYLVFFGRCFKDFGVMKNIASSEKAGPKNRILFNILCTLPIIVLLGIFGYLAWDRMAHRGPQARDISSQPFASVVIGELKANLFAQGNALRTSGNDLLIEFRNSQNKLTDVGKVTFELKLIKPDAVMHSIGNVMRTATAGQYRTTAAPQTAGDWTATLGFSGPQSTGQTNFITTVK
jgi:hypothetical protein